MPAQPLGNCCSRASSLTHCSAPLDLILPHHRALPIKASHRSRQKIFPHATKLVLSSTLRHLAPSLTTSNAICPASGARAHRISSTHAGSPPPQPLSSVSNAPCILFMIGLWLTCPLSFPSCRTILELLPSTRALPLPQNPAAPLNLHHLAVSMLVWYAAALVSLIGEFPA
jgi:hypothetical protein